VATRISPPAFIRGAAPALRGGAPSDQSRVQPRVGAYAHGRVPRDVRRPQVLALASDLFIERGFAAASMDELAKRAGVSKPVIYDLVGSKEALFGEVCAQEAAALAEAVQSAVAAESDQDRKLYAGALAFFRFAEQRRAAWDALLSADAAPVNAELNAARRFQAASVARMLAEAAESTGAPLDPTFTDACAHAINGALEALSVWWRDHPAVSAEALATLADNLVSPGLRAFRDR
jgi:AcrR family transcriptional regulator